MSKNEQLKDAIDSIKYRHKVKQSEIAERLGVRNTYLSDMINGRVAFSANTKTQLSELFSYTFNDEKSTGALHLAKKDETAISNNEILFMVPLLPIAAQGGGLNDFVVSVKAEDCERVVSPVKTVDFALTVTGESMAPEYPSGSQILVKKINERAFIEWGKVYVLDTCNGTVVKEIRRSLIEDEVLCVSINQDPKYSPFSVKLADVYGMYRVVMCMSLK